jgi:hypothetical protein
MIMAATAEAVRTKQQSGLDVSALQHALAYACTAARADLACVGRWSWWVDDQRVASVLITDGGDDLRADCDPTALHELLCGRASELEELMRGTLVLQGSVQAAMQALKVLPDIACTYGRSQGADGIDDRQINVLRRLRYPEVPEDGGFPDRLSVSPSDQTLLVALILVGLSTPCRAVQSAHLAHVCRQDPAVGSRLVLLLTELSDLLAGKSNRTIDLPVVCRPAED